MLTQVDRIQLVVPDGARAARAFADLLGAAIAREDAIAALGARRTVLALGTSEVELLEPDGAGPVATFLAATRGGVYAAGFATRDAAAVSAGLRAQGVAFEATGEQLLVAPEALGAPGLRVVVTPERTRERVGLASHLYEVTLLTSDWKGTADTLARRFALDPGGFVPIRSEEFGYEGSLTLFRRGLLDRVEAITPLDPAKTMGRFFARRGPSFYMCYVESDDTAALRERLLERAPRDFTGPREGPAPDNLWIHPAALGGLLLGVSRRTFAWTWSGSPERVQPLAGSRA